MTTRLTGWFAVLGSLTFCVGRALGQGGAWTPKAPLPLPSPPCSTTPPTAGLYGPSATAVNGILYVVGGACGGSLPGTAFAYNSVTDTWTSKAHMPVPLAYMAAGALNDLVYAVGGNDFSSAHVDNQVYNPLINTWTSKAPFPAPTYNLGVAAVNGLLYAVGGTGNAGPGCPGGFCSSLYAYDPLADTWTLKSPMPTGRFGLGVTVTNGILYAIGGAVPGGSAYIATSTVEAYDPVSNTWTTKAPMPTAREFLGAAAINGFIYAVGGFSSSTSTALATVEAYNPVTDTWTAVTPMSTPREIFGIGVVNGAMYAAAGLNSSEQLESVEAFTPTVVCSPPTITAISARPNVLWPPNHNMIPVNVSVTTSGGCGAVSCKIVSVASNEPIDPDGDWVIIGDFTLHLRAARSGDGTGRVYNITVQCRDASGNTDTKSVIVTVPHDRGH